jgi:exonuclease VII small subunit
MAQIALDLDLVKRLTRLIDTDDIVVCADGSCIRFYKVWDNPWETHWEAQAYGPNPKAAIAELEALIAKVEAARQRWEEARLAFERGEARGADVSSARGDYKRALEKLRGRLKRDREYLTEILTDPIAQDVEVEEDACERLADILAELCPCQD